MYVISLAPENIVPVVPNPTVESTVRTLEPDSAVFKHFVLGVTTKSPSIVVSSP